MEEVTPHYWFTRSQVNDPGTWRPHTAGAEINCPLCSEAGILVAADIDEMGCALFACGGACKFNYLVVLDAWRMTTRTKQ